jgi:hypothetical protein
MNKNRILKKIAVALLFCAITLPILAQTNEPTSESQVATNTSAFQSNSAAATKHKPKKTNLSGLDGPVRIDNTGIHVGGAEPVDINWGNNNGGPFGPLDFGKTLVALAPFVFVLCILVIIFYFRYRRNKMANEILRAMIEKGIPITPELVDSLKNKQSGAFRQTPFAEGFPFPKRSRHRCLLPGLILAGIGMALLFSNGHHSTGGWIVLFIGIAFLIVWLVERNDQNNSPPNPPNPPKQ